LNPLQKLSEHPLKVNLRYQRITQKRKLVKNNLEISAIGLGCMSMSFSYGPAGDQQEMISLILSPRLKWPQAKTASVHGLRCAWRV
jgi:hypothetical protein